MDYLVNHSFRISRSQGMSYLRESRGHHDTVSIFRLFVLSIRPSVETQIIRMPPDGFL